MDKQRTQETADDRRSKWESRNFQRRWLESIVLSGSDNVLMMINIPVLGVGLDVRAMIADVSESIREHSGTDRTFGWDNIHSSKPRRITWAEKTDGQPVRPVMIHESNLPNRTWYVGPEGLMGWDKAVSGWRYLTEDEVAATDLLNGPSVVVA